MIRSELLQVAETIAREKGIQQSEVINAIEQAIEKAARAKYGQYHDIRAKIDHKSGEVTLVAAYRVVEDVNDDNIEISLEDAKRKNADAKLDDEILETLPPINFGRVGAQTARQVVYQRIREIERHQQFLEYKDRVGDVINGVVRRVEFGNIIVDLGRTEAIIRRDELIPREVYRPGDRVRAYIYDVRHEQKGPQIFLSRSHPQFMAKLFLQEVPEIYDGLIHIKSVARDPGSRAKIAVFAPDSSIDAVGSCVGVRGSRVQAVVNELRGEKVDIVLWSPSMANFVINALAPAEIKKVVVDEDTNRIEVVLQDDQLSLAIGRRGQNVRLASILTGCSIDILTESQELERRSRETKEFSALYIEALDVDEVIAHLLIAENYRSVEEIAAADTNELASIEGFDSDVAEELKQRAFEYLTKKQKEDLENFTQLGGSQDLLDFESNLNISILLHLASQGIKTLDDFADLAGDELVEILKDKQTISLDKANDLIMKAREHWFENENKGA